MAIELSDQVRGALQALVDGLRVMRVDARWVPAAQWHLTVKFLGEVPDGEVAGVCAGVGRAGRESEPFELRTQGCGCFPPHGAVRIVWAGVEDLSGRLLNCVSAVEREMEKVGYPVEQRPFAAHVTIGRVKEDISRGKIREAVQAAKLRSAEQNVEDLVVMSSILRPSGSEYSVVSRARLGAVEEGMR